MKHFPLLPLMFLFTLISGCTPAVLITSASIATQTATDPRSTGRQIDDGTLTLRVSHAISSAGFRYSLNRFQVFTDVIHDSYSIKPTDMFCLYFIFSAADYR
ncbi:hypothetical protein GL392_18215 [Salmonella enterica]|nr:hypothetical protein [Salmonella enterica]EEN5778499.1 hypothetical protein [Salmonella enterica]